MKMIDLMVSIWREKGVPELDIARSRRKCEATPIMQRDVSDPVEREWWRGFLISAYEAAEALSPGEFRQFHSELSQDCERRTARN